MEHTEIIAHGAEAILYKAEDEVVKQRLSKGYRLPQLDESLRKFRTRREVKVLQKLKQSSLACPKVRDFSDVEMSIVMDFIPGEKLRDVLQGTKEYHALAHQLGKNVGKMHAHHIIHGDLTTSNLILDARSNEIVFIDFGLSSFSEKAEDKAVDLFLLERALESAHYQHYPKIFQEVLEGYKEGNKDASLVLERLEKVRKRGRNKNKL